jgi:hypothetical protein
VGQKLLGLDGAMVLEIFILKSMDAYPSTAEGERDDQRHATGTIAQSCDRRSLPSAHAHSVGVDLVAGLVKAKGAST